MYSTEYVAYKHIIESEKEQATKLNQHVLSKLRECPRYLYPIKLKHVYEKNQLLNHSSYTDDFILISEFSEIEGPKPLFTIPIDGGCNFNKNDYSLNVMCVDFHSSQQQQQMYDNTTATTSTNLTSIASSNTSRFSLSKDTSIINYWDLTAGGIASYIHHFTLYDIEARGFVRPFCISYITYDRVKIESYFNKLTQYFTKITNLFKKSNLNVFKNNLNEHMKNLYYTREKYLLWLDINNKNTFKNQEERQEYLNKYDIDLRADLKFSKFTLQTLNNLINEIESVLDVVKQELEVQNWYEDDDVDGVDYDDDGGELSDNNNMMTMKGQNNNEQRVIDHGIDLLTRNCDSITKVFVNSNNLDDYINRSKSCPINHHSSIKKLKIKKKHHQENYNKKNITSNCKLILDLYGSITYSFSTSTVNNGLKNYQKIMKNIYQLAPKTARLAFKKLRMLHKHYSKPYYLLKLNDIELRRVNKIEKTSDLLQIKHNSLNQTLLNNFWFITLGDCLLYDLSFKVNILNYYQNLLCQQSSDMSTIKTNKTLNLNNDIKYYSINTASMGSVNNTNVHHHGNGNGNINGDGDVDDDIKKFSISMSKYYTPLNNDDEDYKHHFNAINGDDDDDDDENDEFLDVHNDNATNAEDDEYERSLHNNHNNDSNDYDFVNSILTHFTRNNSTTIKNENFNSHIHNDVKLLNKKYLELNEFNFESVLRTIVYKQFPNSLQHILYTLLKGRPLVIISRYRLNYDKLSLIIDCLKNFIPNNLMSIKTTSVTETSSATVIYESKQIKLIDLKTYKIIGISLNQPPSALALASTSNSSLNNNNEQSTDHTIKYQDDSLLLLKYVPITIRNYISILDIDKLTFIGPKYNGSYLQQTILTKFKYFHNDTLCYLYFTQCFNNFYLKFAYLLNYSTLFKQKLQSQLQSEQLSFLQKFFGSASSAASISSSFTSSMSSSLSMSNSISNNISGSSINISNSTSSSSSSTYTYYTNIDQCDLNIINYLIKSFKLKQLYIYNHVKSNDENECVNETKVEKEEQKLCNKNNLNTGDDDGGGGISAEDADGGDGAVIDSTTTITTNLSDHVTINNNSDFELPLLIEYENLTTFNS